MTKYDSANDVIEPTNVSDPITESPFYCGDDGNGSSLPNGDLVTSGGLYMMNDDGGLVFQMSTESGLTADKSFQAKGTIDLHKKEATIHTKSMLGAISYKTDTDASEHKSLFRKRVTITGLEDSGLGLLSGTPRFAVQVIGKDDYFYIFDVYDADHQKTISHSSTPKCKHGHNHDRTVTGVTGDVYVQYGNIVYQGAFSATEIRIADDKKQDFCQV